MTNAVANENGSVLRDILRWAIPAVIGAAVTFGAMQSRLDSLSTKVDRETVDLMFRAQQSEHSAILANQGAFERRVSRLEEIVERNSNRLTRLEAALERMK
jgi:tetrahydromethanopterin S-methyltransferase subunit G